MTLYLMQHGKPVSKEENPLKPLSAEGIEDVQGMAEYLKARDIMPDRAYHSGKTRARETANIIIPRLNSACVIEERGGLSPLDDVREIADEIQETRDALFIIGHLPHLSKLAALLLACHENKPVLRFQQGGVVCLQRGEEGWAVLWMLTPEIITGGTR